MPSQPSLDIGSFPTYTKQKINLGSTQTTNATPIVAYSIPMTTNQMLFVNIMFSCSDSTWSKGLAQSPIAAYFLRATGNITNASTTIGIGLNINLTLVPPTLTFVVNNTTQSVDITVTGQASTTYNWHIEGNYILSN